MILNSAQQLIALKLIPQIGSRTFNSILDLEIPLDTIFSVQAQRLIDFGIPSKIAHSIESCALGALSQAKSIVDHCNHIGVTVIGYGTSGYPEQLAQCGDAPAVLFVRGDVSVLSNPYAISCVGTRKCNGQGLRVTNDIISGAAQSGVGVSIVSGLALGIDRASHLASIENNLPTVAVLPGFVDDITPSSHHSLARRIVDRGGALVSEHPPGTTLSRSHFLSRNRVIAGLSMATIMFQSDRKGGSMVTADLANGYDREVFTPMASLSDLGFEGNVDLLRSSRANALVSFGDIMQVMGWTGCSRASARDLEQCLAGLTPSELRVYSIFPERDLVGIDQVAYQADMSISVASSTLTMLEIKGLIATCKGRLYQRVR